jgi:ATP-dependent exoDNAse (exonuclease V) beta subunit
MSNTPNYLATLNAHERDPDISFQEEGHIYTVKGEQGYTSVTTFIHKLFPHFDSTQIIQQILNNKRRNDPTYKYYGKTKEDILHEWDVNRDAASAAGTKMHYDIECYFNNIYNENKSIEFEYFHRFLKDFVHCNNGLELKPYRTEWCVYFEEYKLSGSIDMVFENPDGTLQIYDWKRCKSIEYEAFKNETAILPSLEHLPNSNYWMYSLQLNLYKTILEKKYGKKVTGLYLVCLHPDNGYKTYDRIDVPFLDKEVCDALDWWKTQLERVTDDSV